MNNYEYIIASLPVLTKDWKPSDGFLPEDWLTMIKNLSSPKDNRLIDTLLEGFNEKTSGPEFYKAAASHKNRFIREYFNFDLLVKNTKVRHLNKALGRPSNSDIFMETNLDQANVAKVETAFETDDILARERAVDALLWARVSEINTFDVFNIEAILGFIAKLLIVSRWLKLDEGSGRLMFAKLLEEVRGTFSGVKLES